MEQENLSPSQPTLGQYGSDREVFERVWRRVMPTDRPDCPFTLYSDEERAQMGRLLDTGSTEPPAPLPAAAGAPCAVGQPELTPERPRPPQAEEDDDAPCLGAASAVYGPLLQELMVHARSAAQTYRALAGRAGSRAGRALAAIAADKARHAKRLGVAYFLISGVWFQPEPTAAPPADCPYPSALRESFLREQRMAARCRTAGARAEDPCLRELFSELAEECAAHAALLRGQLEQL